MVLRSARSLGLQTTSQFVCWTKFSPLCAASAKVRGAVAPARYEAAPDTTIDAMDGYFK